MTVAHSTRRVEDMDSEEGKEGKEIQRQPNNPQPKAVSVILRVRPLSTIEHANPSVKNVVQCLKSGIVVSGSQRGSESRFYGARNAVQRPQHFKVDQVFHPHDTQLEVYSACRPIVAACLEGINGSILAYGATGSGKTHTMFGGGMSAAGVVYQAVQDILEAKERLEMEEHKVVTLRCTFLEVYNEEVFDLLAPVGPRGKRTPLHLRDLGLDEEEPSPTSVNPETLTIKGLTQVTPATGEEFAKCVKLGHSNRFTASTDANTHSSRSHAVLTVEVEVQDTLTPSSGTVGRIRFCDLAGSERAAGTSNFGVRLREGGNINRSLLALSAVVQALGEVKRNPKRNRYVPYRGSKLTRVLRDCLGGNCRTQMLFCVSPSSFNYDETVNTMLFAIKVKEIQVHAKRHELRLDPKEVARSQELLIEDLRSELAATREELLQLRGARNSRLTVAHSVPRADTGQSAEVQPSSTIATSLNSSIGYGAKAAPTGDAATCPLTVVSECGAAETQSGSARALSEESSKKKAVAPLLPRTCTRSEISDTYTKLQMKLNALSVKKETLYRGMKEAQEKSSEVDVRLRQQTWKLAHFLLSSSNKAVSMLGLGSSSNINGTRNGLRSKVSGNSLGHTAPVGVAGLWHTIEKMTKENAARGDEMGRLMKKMNETDCAIASVREELLRERQHPMLELLLDNVRLRQSCTEAECLAAHYHQKCRSGENREEEYKQALSICTSSIRHTMPLINSVGLRGEGQRALLYAKLPLIETKGMIAVCDKSMHNPSSQMDASSSSSSLFSPASPISAITKTDTPTGSNGRKATAGGAVSFSLLGQTEKGSALKQKGKATAQVTPPPFARSYTTSTLIREPQVNGTEHSTASNHTSTKANANSSNRRTRKNTIKKKLASGTSGGAVLRNTKPKTAGAKNTNTEPSASRLAGAMPFCRSRTEIGPRQTRGKENRIRASDGNPFLALGAMQKSGMSVSGGHAEKNGSAYARLQNVPLQRSVSTRALSPHTRNRMASPHSFGAAKEKESPRQLRRCVSAMKPRPSSESEGSQKAKAGRRARVRFQLSGAEGKPGAHKLQHAELVARFAELRSEVRHWKEGKAKTEAGRKGNQ